MSRVTRSAGQALHPAPAPPFTTSTLQQEASRKLRMSSKNAMRVAQRLYENGYITYMRTDSVTLSQSAISAARAQARDLYGADYVPGRRAVYTSKVQERPGGPRGDPPGRGPFRTPAQVAGELRGEEFALYELIWKRTLASQMADARGSTATVKLGGDCPTGGWSNCPRAAPSSPSVASSRHTKKADEEPPGQAPARTSRSGACRSCAEGVAMTTVLDAKRRGTRPRRRRATPRRPS
jgi:DNA topoisomerase-1